MSQATTYWYPPHYLSTVEEASNRLQFMSPHFSPMSTSGGAFSLTEGFLLQRAEMNKLGINLTFSKSGVVQQTQYFWS